MKKIVQTNREKKTPKERKEERPYLVEGRQKNKGKSKRFQP